MPFVSSPDLETIGKHMASLHAGETLESAINDAVSQTHMLTRLQVAAYAAGADIEMVNAISLFYDDGEMWVGVPRGPFGPEAVDLEYGTSETPPRAWLRATIARGQRTYQDALSAALTDRFLGA